MPIVRKSRLSRCHTTDAPKHASDSQLRHMSQSVAPSGSLALPHESDGHSYPPPYGSKVYYESPVRTPRTNARKRRSLKKCLVRIYASDMETWHAVDGLAREVRAIRRAVSALEDELAPEERKPRWVRTVHATGEFSRGTSRGRRAVGD
jgi:hypothetical protein